MITNAAGNLLTANADALVNTVNSVGVMGKGIALQFKQAFPENFVQYRRACENGLVEPGRMFVVATGLLEKPKFIINFPTKRHWKGKSRIEDIKSGLTALIHDVERLEIRSVAIPPLGCGNGGLAWNTVRPLILAAFEKLPHVHVLLYGPSGAPDCDEMPVNTSKPSMTRGRALLVKLIQRYHVPGYRLSRLEMQKLAYFLQSAGEEMKLTFVKHQYGPYAANLNHALVRMEGHFIRGVGDFTNETRIHVVDDAVPAADEALASDASASARLARVTALIEGFENPYGMELLATVHWVAVQGGAKSADDAISQIHAWSPRKKKLFQPNHIRVAWQQLDDAGWFSPPSNN